MKRNIDLNEEQTTSKSSLNQDEEETSLLLSMVDINILQNVFIQLVNGYKYSIGEIKKSFTLLLNFCLSCKLFSHISQQPLFPLILNNININLNYKKYLKILFINQKVENNSWYEKKDINAILYESCSIGCHDMINTLIDYGANINHQQGSQKWTPLSIATIKRNIKTVEKLIKFKNLNINQQDINKSTALILICFQGIEDIDLVKTLLSRKDIDIHIMDDESMTALDWAKHEKSENLIEILENHET